MGGSFGSMVRTAAVVAHGGELRDEHVTARADLLTSAKTHAVFY